MFVVVELDYALAAADLLGSDGVAGSKVHDGRVVVDVWIWRQRRHLQL